MASKGISVSSLIKQKCVLNFEEKVSGYITSVGETYTVKTVEGYCEVNPSDIQLDYRQEDVRRFVIGRLGEDLPAFESSLRKRGQFPIEKLPVIESTMGRVKSTFFPINIGNVSFDVSRAPLVIDVAEPCE
jgi:hypothetical protein